MKIGVQSLSGAIKDHWKFEWDFTIRFHIIVCVSIKQLVNFNSPFNFLSMMSERAKVLKVSELPFRGKGFN